MKVHIDYFLHKEARSFSDKVASGFICWLAHTADFFFKKRYGHRAIVLETVAAVPGMVGGLVEHLSSLRHIRSDHGKIKILLNEAENERMHLMVYSHIARPSKIERFAIALIQAIFFVLYLSIYIISKKTAHRAVGYLEEQAVHSYTVYLNLIDSGDIHDKPAPRVAIEYWGLKEDATIRDVVLATRDDEVLHRDQNHHFADMLVGK